MEKCVRYNEWTFLAWSKLLTAVAVQETLNKVIGRIGFQANPDMFPLHGGVGNGKLYS